MSDTISSDSVAQDQLRAFIERIERMEEEKKAVSDDIKEIYAEAKGNGFDTKVLRKIVAIRKQDHSERMEQEALLELYMAALGMAVAPPEDDDEPLPPSRNKTEAQLGLAAAAENFRKSVDRMGSTVSIEAPGHAPVVITPRSQALEARAASTYQPMLFPWKEEGP